MEASVRARGTWCGVAVGRWPPEGGSERPRGGIGAIGFSSKNLTWGVIRSLVPITAGLPQTGSAALRMTVLGHPGSWSCRWLPLLLLLLLGTGRDPGVEGVTHYKAGDPVILYVNKVGPYHNPQETYHYYQLPVCCPEKIRHKSLSLGEVLDGDRMAESLYEIRFRENVEKRILCHMQLSSAQVSLSTLTRT